MKCFSCNVFFKYPWAEILTNIMVQLTITYARKKNHTMLSFPLDDHVILVTVNNNINSMLLARKIIDKINSLQNQLD